MGCSHGGGNTSSLVAADCKKNKLFSRTPCTYAIYCKFVTMILFICMNMKLIFFTGAWLRSRCPPRDRWLDGPQVHEDTAIDTLEWPWRKWSNVIFKDLNILSSSNMKIF